MKHCTKLWAVFHDGLLAAWTLSDNERGAIDEFIKGTAWGDIGDWNIARERGYTVRRVTVEWEG